MWGEFDKMKAWTNTADYMQQESERCFCIFKYR